MRLVANCYTPFTFTFEFEVVQREHERHDVERLTTDAASRLYHVCCNATRHTMTAVIQSMHRVTVTSFQCQLASAAILRVKLLEIGLIFIVIALKYVLLASQ